MTFVTYDRRSSTTLLTLAVPSYRPCFSSSDRFFVLLCNLCCLSFHKPPGLYLSCLSLFLLVSLGMLVNWYLPVCYLPRRMSIHSVRIIIFLNYVHTLYCLIYGSYSFSLLQSALRIRNITIA